MLAFVFPARTFARIVRTLPCLGIVATLVLAGCASSEVGMVCPIAGGGMLTVYLTPQGPRPAENDDFKVETANFIPNIEQKQLVYTFSLLAKKGKAPQRIQIEDVSDAQAEILLVDAEPKLDAKRVWRGNASPKTAGDRALAWLFYEGNSTRIYRFTIVTADGRPLVMHQAAIHPVFVKEAVRKILGMTP